MTIYRQLQAVTKPNHLEGDGCDLLVKKTKEVMEVLGRYAHKDYMTEFRHVKDNQTWIRVPCAYDPWWYYQGARPIER